MKGLVLAEQAHIENILPAVDITGGKTAQAFSMRNHGHASILLIVGVSAAAFTKIILNQCTDVSGTGAVPIPFYLYKQETAGANQDVVGSRSQVLATGYTPSANDNIFYCIELDASELSDGFAYVQLQLTNGANSVIATALAILSGPRFSGVSSPTATV